MQLIVGAGVVFIALGCSNSNFVQIPQDAPLPTPTPRLHSSCINSNTLSMQLQSPRVSEVALSFERCPLETPKDAPKAEYRNPISDLKWYKYSQEKGLSIEVPEFFRNSSGSIYVISRTKNGIYSHSCGKADFDFDDTKPLIDFTYLPERVSNTEDNIRWKVADERGLAPGQSYATLNGKQIVTQSPDPTGEHDIFQHHYIYRSQNQLQPGTNVLRVHATDNCHNTEQLSYEWVYDPNAPKVTFTSKKPKKNALEVNLNFNVTDPEPGAGLKSIECSKDNKKSFSPCSKGSIKTLAQNGANSVWVRATDKAGNVALKSFDWQSDIVAPTIKFLTHPATAQHQGKNYSAQNQPSFSYLGTDNEGPVRYQCALIKDKTPLALTNCQNNTQHMLPLLQDGDYVFQVKAIDMAQNASLPAEFVWSVDATAPSLQITAAPGMNSTKLLGVGDKAVVQFVAMDTGTGLARVECLVNNKTHACPLNASHQGKLSITKHKEGTNTVTIKATDHVGNSTQVEHQYNFRKENPTILFDSGTAHLSPQKSSHKQNPWIEHALRALNPLPRAWAEESGTKGTDSADTSSAAKECSGHVLVGQGEQDINFTVIPCAGLEGSDTPEDCLAAKAIECSVDNKTYTNCMVGTNKGQFKTPNSKSGHYKLFVKSRNQAGNTTVKCYNWQVDADAPRIALTGVPAYITPDEANKSPEKEPVKEPGKEFNWKHIPTKLCQGEGCAKGLPLSQKPLSITGEQYRFQFEGKDDQGDPSLADKSVQYECVLKRSGRAVVGPKECEPGMFYTKLMESSEYSFEVVAIDSVGNRSKPATWHFMLDRYGPTFHFSKVPGGLVKNKKNEWQFRRWPVIGKEAENTLLLKRARDRFVHIAKLECAELDSYPHPDTPCHGVFSTAALDFPTEFVPLVMDYKDAKENTCHTARLEAEDMFGHRSTLAYKWYVDTLAPKIEINKHPTKKTSHTGAEFLVTALDFNSAEKAKCQNNPRRELTPTETQETELVLSYSLDGAAWKECNYKTCPIKVQGLKRGQHKLSLKAQDRAGNVATKDFTWDITSTGPVLSATPVWSESSFWQKAPTGDEGSFFQNIPGEFTVNLKPIQGTSIKNYNCLCTPQDPTTCKYDANKSSLSVKVANTKPGTHQCTLKAYDNLGAVNSTQISWQVLPQYQVYKYSFNHRASKDMDVLVVLKDHKDLKKLKLQKIWQHLLPALSSLGEWEFRVALSTDTLLREGRVFPVSQQMGSFVTPFHTKSLSLEAFNKIWVAAVKQSLNTDLTKIAPLPVQSFARPYAATKVVLVGASRFSPLGEAEQAVESVSGLFSNPPQMHSVVLLKENMCATEAPGELTSCLSDKASCYESFVCTSTGLQAVLERLGTKELNAESHAKWQLPYAPAPEHPKYQLQLLDPQGNLVDPSLYKVQGSTILFPDEDALPRGQYTVQYVRTLEQ